MFGPSLYGPLPFVLRKLCRYGQGALPDVTANHIQLKMWNMVFTIMR
jgi:hypothetical protein